MSDIIKQADDFHDRENYKVVFSIRIATELCADYPFFNNLVAIEKNHKNPTQRVWIFRRSVEFDETFEQLITEALKAREERNKVMVSFNAL